MKRATAFLRSVVWTSALAVGLVVGAIVTAALGNYMGALVLAVCSVTFGLLANKE